jgi:hypothetical protein
MYWHLELLLCPFLAMTIYLPGHVYHLTTVVVASEAESRVDLSMCFAPEIFIFRV